MSSPSSQGKNTPELGQIYNLTSRIDIGRYISWNSRTLYSWWALWTS
ncbi:MAG TPA: hypothetical protein VFC05_09310 [Nitrososphaeraceae archaeon]|nr:hypothetical protein [Nitrososphaeraceae archaeon]